jgi:hypothetical protein
MRSPVPSPTISLPGCPARGLGRKQPGPDSAAKHLCDDLAEDRTPQKWPAEGDKGEAEAVDQGGDQVRGVDALGASAVIKRAIHRRIGNARQDEGQAARQGNMLRAAEKQRDEPAHGD